GPCPRPAGRLHARSAALEALQPGRARAGDRAVPGPRGAPAGGSARDAHRQPGLEAVASSGMSFVVDPAIEEYAEAHTSPDGELFERLAVETREKTSAPQMMVGRIEGQLLALLVRLSGARRILELGPFA